jgi:hypothetical protein
MNDNMPVLELLQKLHEAGVTIRADGDRLIASPSERLTDELRALIRANKPVLLAGIQTHKPARPAAGLQPAPVKAFECMRCVRLTMRIEHHMGTRRVFWWRCERGYVLMEGRNYGERVMLAPPECNDFQQWQVGTP